uniref:Uncharacterized protein n=1 Tax=Utricularia reniformis TaxID=192314 RepID=A0A1Y0B2P7_9LAMI|nr:hypothetical protein AEK19_MT1481 [Utricularia reniformis]ART31671.1 hypothetical protein AEK19_MT1481 [Utricularia reniformis]
MSDCSSFGLKEGSKQPESLVWSDSFPTPIRKYPFFRDFLSNFLASLRY